MIMSLLENFDKAWEITVLPQPNAPGIAVVPPCTQLIQVSRRYYAASYITHGKSASRMR